MPADPIQKHTLLRSVLLHLVPGILTGAAYFLLRAPLQQAGYPSAFALTLAAIFVLIPVELGFLLYQGKRRSGRYTLRSVISYTDPLPWWQYLTWTVGVFVVLGLIFPLLNPVSVFLQEKIFFWMPGLDMGLNGAYSRPALTLTYALFFVFIVVLAPLTEELYFRGYLLPRVPGKLPVLLHSFLFAAYHIFSPWMVVARTLGLLPLVYAVQRKNIYIGMIVHVILNSLDVIAAVAFIAAMT